VNPDPKNIPDVDNQPSAADLGFNVLRTGQTSVPQKKLSKEELAGGSYKRLSRKNIIRLGGMVGGLAFLAIISFGGIFIINYSRNRAIVKNGVSNQAVVTPDNIKSTALDVSDPSKTFVVNSNTAIAGALSVQKDLNLKGRLVTNGALSVNGLAVSGATSLSATTIASTLNVAGSTTLQGGLTVGNSLNVNGPLNVNGNASFSGDVSANTFNARSTFNTGNIIFSGHVVSGGSTPSISGYSPVLGAGGSAVISGNDTAGTVTIHTGSIVGNSGTLATVVFRTPYSNSGPKVVLTPNGQSAGEIQFYVTHNMNQFQIGYSCRIYFDGVNTQCTKLLANSDYSFDYVVMQ
jgi:cytoskeletal protein CcmA (bactofilin family)